MVENLNIAGGTELSSDDTDHTSSYTLPTTDGWTVSDGKLILPASSASGFIIPSVFNDNTSNYAYLYNSGNRSNCGEYEQNTPYYSYYSWDTATLGSGRSLAAVDADAPYSICPKGWRLPTTGGLYATNNPSNNVWKRGDYYRLATAYGVNLEENSL